MDRDIYSNKFILNVQQVLLVGDVQLKQDKKYCIETAIKNCNYCTSYVAPQQKRIIVWLEKFPFKRANDTVFSFCLREIQYSEYDQPKIIAFADCNYDQIVDYQQNQKRISLYFQSQKVAELLISFQFEKQVINEQFNRKIIQFTEITLKNVDPLISKISMIMKVGQSKQKFAERENVHLIKSIVFNQTFSTIFSENQKIVIDFFIDEQHQLKPFYQNDSKRDSSKMLMYLNSYEILLSAFKTNAGNFTDHMKFDGIVFAQLTMKYQIVDLNPRMKQIQPTQVLGDLMKRRDVGIAIDKEILAKSSLKLTIRKIKFQIKNHLMLKGSSYPQILIQHNQQSYLCDLTDLSSVQVEWALNIDAKLYDPISWEIIEIQYSFGKKETISLYRGSFLLGDQCVPQMTQFQTGFLNTTIDQREYIPVENTDAFIVFQIQTSKNIPKSKNSGHNPNNETQFSNLNNMSRFEQPQQIAQEYPKTPQGPQEINNLESTHEHKQPLIMNEPEYEQEYPIIMMKLSDFVAIYENNIAQTFTSFTYTMRIQVLREVCEFQSSVEQGMMIEWNDTFMRQSPFVDFYDENGLEKDNYKIDFEILKLAQNKRESTIVGKGSTTFSFRESNIINNPNTIVEIFDPMIRNEIILKLYFNLQLILDKSQKMPRQLPYGEINNGLKIGWNPPPQNSSSIYDDPKYNYTQSIKNLIASKPSPKGGVKFPDIRKNQLSLNHNNIVNQEDEDIQFNQLFSNQNLNTINENDYYGPRYSMNQQSKYASTENLTSIDKEKDNYYQRLQNLKEHQRSTINQNNESMGLQKLMYEAQLYNKLFNHEKNEDKRYENVQTLVKIDSTHPLYEVYNDEIFKTSDVNNSNLDSDFSFEEAKQPQTNNPGSQEKPVNSSQPDKNLSQIKSVLTEAQDLNIDPNFQHQVPPQQQKTINNSSSASNSQVQPQEIKQPSSSQKPEESKPPANNQNKPEENSKTISGNNSQVYKSQPGNQSPSQNQSAVHSRNPSVTFDDLYKKVDSGQLSIEDQKVVNDTVISFIINPQSQKTLKIKSLNLLYKIGKYDSKKPEQKQKEENTEIPLNPEKKSVEVVQTQLQEIQIDNYFQQISSGISIENEDKDLRMAYLTLLIGYYENHTNFFINRSLRQHLYIHHEKIVTQNDKVETAGKYNDEILKVKHLLEVIDKKNNPK